MTESTEAIFQIQWQTVEQLKAFIESMKAEKQSEYIRKIRELEEELNHLKTSKKYGIVFEEKREDFEERARNALPVLQEVESMRIDDAGENLTNIVIEGDNYHALSCLRYTHKGKVDVIYIDPPYNTGNKDFIYNDRFVDKEDTYRHSKWLSFMKKRLVLAQELLSESGVIFISIDDNEQAQLKMLCDEVFGEGNFVWEFIWKNKLWWGNDSSVFVTEHEYILCFGKNINFVKKFTLPNVDNWKYLYFDEFLESRWKFAIEALYRSSIQYSESLFYPIICPDNSIIYPNESDKSSTKHIWRWSKETFEKKKNEWRVIFKETKNWWRVFTKQYFNENDDGTERRLSVRSIIDIIGNRQWTELLKNIFDNDKIFNNPKPIELISYLLKLISNPNSLILDFFAGSGTTGHAVLELNREDGGNRQFILCSNREATAEQPDKNICRDITYERVKRVATGYKNSKGESISGLGGNIRYYQTDFIQIEKSRENLKQKFMLRCNDLIMLKENTFDEVTLQNPIPWLFLYRNGERYTAVAYDYLYLDQVRDFLRSLNRPVSLYIFSISSWFIEEFEDMKDMVDVKSIPEEILEVYLRIFNL